MTTSLKPQRGPLPFAPLNKISQAFWDGCERAELMYQQCESCGHANFPATEHCRDCLRRNLRWTTSSGLGTVYSWTVVHRPVSPEYRTPYAPAIITLAEGFQMLSSLIDLETYELRVDLEVAVRFERDTAGRSVPYFGPRRGATK